MSEVTASSPEKTDEPFHFSYKYTRKEFGDWPNRRIVAPAPWMALLAPGDEELLKVAAYWDTLGWVHERMSNLDVAEKYLRPAWTLTQDGVVAGHLCHLYKRVHKVGLAIEMCRLAIYRVPMSEGLALSQYKTERDAAQEIWIT